jgi:hypothetical protein
MGVARRRRAAARVDILTTSQPPLPCVRAACTGATTYSMRTTLDDRYTVDGPAGTPTPSKRKPWAGANRPRRDRPPYSSMWPRAAHRAKRNPTLTTTSPTTCGRSLLDREISPTGGRGGGNGRAAPGAREGGGTTATPEKRARDCQPPGRSSGVTPTATATRRGRLLVRRPASARPGSPWAIDTLREACVAAPGGRVDGRARRPVATHRCTYGPPSVSVQGAPTLPTVAFSFSQRAMGQGNVWCRVCLHVKTCTSCLSSM